MLCTQEKISIGYVNIITLLNVQIFLYYSYNMCDFTLVINFDFVDLITKFNDAIIQL